MKVRALKYFQQLFNCDERLAPIPNFNISFDDAISVEMVVRLWSYPCMEEIRGVLFRMPRGKALDPEGITVEISMHHWEVIKNDFLDVTLHFFHSSQNAQTTKSYILGAYTEARLSIILRRLSPNLLFGSDLQSNSLASSQLTKVNSSKSYCWESNRIYQGKRDL